MKKRLVSFSLICVLIISLISCDISTDIALGKGQRVLPDEVADSVEVISMVGSFRESIMRAKYLERFYDSKITNIDTLFTETYETDGSLKYRLTCNKAEINEAKNIMTAMGKVVIISDNGVLRTEKLVWNQNSDIIITETDFVLVREDNTLRGQYLKTDLEFNNIEMKKIKGEGTLKEGDFNDY